MLSVSVCFLRWLDGYTWMSSLTRVRIVKYFKVVGQVHIDVPTDPVTLSSILRWLDRYASMCPQTRVRIVNQLLTSRTTEHTFYIYVFSMEAKTMTTFTQMT